MGMLVNRRTFLGGTLAATALLGIVSARGQEISGIQVAVLTNAGGAHVEAYLGGLAAAPEVASVVLADPDGKWEGDARKALGDRLAAVYPSYGALFAAEKPAMALITLEAALAPAAIDAALDAGCHVLAEKPACVDVADFAALAAKAEAKGRHLMLALATRRNPEVLKAKELIAGGAIGRVYGLQVNFVKDQRRLTSRNFQESWFCDKTRAGGGNLAWLGIHWLDMAMYVTGSPVSQVAGFATNVGGQPINIEDSAALSLRFENGALGSMTSAYYLDGGSQSMLKVWGEKGWLELGSDAPGKVRWYSTAGERPVTETFESPAHSSYSAYVRACVRASAGLEPPPVSGADCLRVLRVVFGLYEASASGTTVTVE